MGRNGEEEREKEREPALLNARAETKLRHQSSVAEAQRQNSKFSDGGVSAL